MSHFFWNTTKYHEDCERIANDLYYLVPGKFKKENENWE